jgi:two-component system alkaline phosphatase synthesis response regulator PhoP
MIMATIYIVEDDVNIREIERYALKNSGYQVEEFECGADLFKRLESKVPALILLDIMLPNEDGLDILTISVQIKTQRRCRSLW